MEKDEIVELWEESEKEWDDIVFLAREAGTDTETIVEVLRREGMKMDRIMNEDRQRAVLKKPIQAGQNLQVNQSQAPKKEIPDVVLKACKEKMEALKASISTVELQIKELQDFMEQGV